MKRATTITLDELLQHQNWVRGLARQLVRDEADVNDVVQEVWLAALRKPPSEPSRVGGWLTRVVRNAAFQARRRDQRRERREQVVTSRPSAPPPEVLLEQAEERARVVNAVQALDEPYRTVILYRYFQEMSARDVAEHLELPVETVRTRIKRGLAVSRGRLDSEHGGDGRAWALALIPLAGNQWTGVGVGLATGTGVGVGSSTGTGAASGVLTGGIAMASSKTAAAIGLGLLVGILGTLGVSQLPATKPDVSAPAGIETSAEPAGVRNDSRGGATRLTPRSERDGSASGGAGAAAFEAALEQVIADHPAAALARGTGRITGAVLTPDGAPVAGAVIWLTPDSSMVNPPWARSRQVPTRTEFLTFASRSFTNRYGGARKTTTNDAGAFVFEHLPAQKFHVAGHHTTYRLSRAEHQAKGALLPDASYEFVAKFVIPVAVRVVGPDGKPVEAALVEYRLQMRPGVSSSRRRRWRAGATPEQLTPGELTVTATGGIDDTLRAPAVTVQLEDGVPVEAITLQFRERRGISGELTFASRSALTTLNVILGRLLEEGVRPAERLAASDVQTFHARRVDRFHFKFLDLEPGRYAVGVRLGQQLLVSQVAEVKDGLTTIELEVPRPDPAAYVDLIAQGPDGKVLKNLNVAQAKQEGSSLSAGGFTPPTVLADGTLRHVHDPRWPDGQRRYVSLQSEQFGVLTFELRSDDPQPRTVRFSEPGAVALQVRAGRGSPPLERLSVRFVRRDLEPQIASVLSRVTTASGTTQLDTDGRIQIAALQPGPYTVLVQLDLRGMGRTLLARDVRISSGENKVDLQLPRLVDLTVRLLAGSSQGTTLMAQRAAWPTATMTREYLMGQMVEDQVRFRFLSPAIYEVRRDRVLMIVDLRSTTTVDFKESTALAARFVEGKKPGYLQSLGLRDGDVVVGVNGSELSRWGDLGTLLWGAGTDNEVGLDVSRRGRSVSYPVDARRLRNVEGLGGYFVPEPR